MRKNKLDKVQKKKTARRNIARKDKPSEMSVNEREEKYRNILENIQEGYFEVDLKGNFTFVNNSMCRIQGYSRKELIGMNSRQYTEKEVAKKVFKAFSEVYKTGKPRKEIDWQIIRKDGTKRYLEASISLRKGSTGEPIGFRGIIRDVTERKSVEEKLWFEGQRFRALADHSSDLIIFMNQRGMVTYINPAVERILGYKVEERIGASAAEYVHQDDIKTALDKLKILAADTNFPVLQMDMRVKDKGGRWHDFETVGSNLVKDNAVETIVIRQRDITERKQAESQRDAAVETLRKSERFFKEVTENSSDILIITDKIGTIKYCSRSIEHFSGYKPEKIIGKNAFSFIHPDERKRAVDEFSKAVLTDDTILIPNAFRVMHKNGSEVYLDGLGRNLLGNPDIAGFVMNVRDVTARKKAEEAALKEYNFSRLALDSLTVPFFMFDPVKHKFFRWNKAFSAVSGYSDREIARIKPIKLIPKTERARLLSMWNGFKAAGRISFEMPVLSRDGKTTLYLLSGNLLTFDGKPYVIGMGIDITERKRMEDTLRNERDLSSVIINSLPGLFYIVDEKSRLLLWNDNFMKITGYSHDELRNKPILDFHRTSEKDSISEKVRQVFLLGENCSEADVVLKNGAVRTFMFNSRKIQYEGRPCIVGTGMDITVQKRAEIALKQFAENLEDANITLRVLMNHRDKDQKEFEEKLQTNINDLVIPYLKKLSQGNLDDHHKIYLRVLESNLSEVLSPFMKDFRSSYKNLTPHEIQIVDLIKKGKNTKEIADMLNASVNTIGTHRNNIRKKLNLRNSKINLRSHILSQA